MDVQEVIILFWRVIWMLRRVVYCVLLMGVIFCSGGLYAVQEGYMLKKIMLILVATNVVASRPTGTPTARANFFLQQNIRLSGPPKKLQTAKITNNYELNHKQIISIKMVNLSGAYYRVLKKNVRMFVCSISPKPMNRFLHRFFPLKTGNHMKILNRKPILCYFRGMRYLQI